MAWGASSSGGVDRYELEQSLNGTSGWERRHNNAAASKHFIDMPTNHYYYRVRACNAVGCSGYRGIAEMEVERTDGIPQGVDPDPDSTSGSGGTEASLSPRLEALRDRRAALEALREGRAGRTIGGSGSGFRYSVKYHYNTRGLLSEVTDTADPAASIWKAQSRDAFGHVNSALLGNGVTVTETLDGATGEIRNIAALSPSAGQVQNLVYDWDARGNLIRRKDQIDDLEETIDSLTGYDALGRLKEASVTAGPTMSWTYDAVGNIQTKTVSGSPDPAHDYSIQYTYSGIGDQLDEFRINGDLAQDVAHDANGNITTRGDVTIQWTPFNKPAWIEKAGETAYFSYGHDRSRYRHDYREPDAETGAMIDASRLYVQGVFEVVLRGTPPSSTEEYHHHVYAEGRVVATHIRRSTQNHTTQWLLRDHLGSIDKVMDENGDELLRQSFDAFGMRRAATWDGPPMEGEVPGVRQFTPRGYTAHEMLDQVDMIHMNGRVYDPLLGRFMSADPIVANPLSSQAWNPYGYVQNRPLALVDPSGFLFVTRCYGDGCAGAQQYGGAIHPGRGGEVGFGDVGAPACSSGQDKDCGSLGDVVDFNGNGSGPTNPDGSGGTGNWRSYYGNGDGTPEPSPETFAAATRLANNGGYGDWFPTTGLVGPALAGPELMSLGVLSHQAVAGTALAPTWPLERILRRRASDDPRNAPLDQGGTPAWLAEGALMLAIRLNDSQYAALGIMSRVVVPTFTVLEAIGVVEIPPWAEPVRKQIGAIQVAAGGVNVGAGIGIGRVALRMGPPYGPLVVAGIYIASGVVSIAVGVDNMTVEP